MLAGWTTSGECFNPRRLSAASVTVPLGSVVEVEDPVQLHHLTLPFTGSVAV